MLKNINLFLLFFKLNLFTTFLNFNSSSQTNLFFTFNKFFFSFLLLKLITKSNHQFLSVYTNNFQLSLLFHNFKVIDEHLVFNSLPIKSQIVLGDCFALNTYFLAIKVVKITLTKKFYKNFFFYLLLIWTPIWYQHNTFFSFYSNFLMTTCTLRLFKFYNGPFFKIYNF